MARASRRRAIIVTGILLAALLLFGCDFFDGFSESGGSVPREGESLYPDPNEPFYDTGEDVVAPPVEMDDSILFDNQNILAVYNGGTSPTFDLPSATVITTIRTYHWNDANGNGSTGTISLKGDDGTVYGPWSTTGAEGQGGVPNAYWTASPGVTVPAGRYTVIDSDPGTWSQNADSGGEGHVIVHGEAAK
jgi:hypothetical protein